MKGLLCVSFCFLFFLFLALPEDVFAGRNEGINVQYECLGGNDYLVSVHLFRDCAEFTDTPDFLDVFFTSSCGAIGFVEIDLQESLEVSQLCPDSLPSSSCNGGALPGVNLSVYSGVVNLPPCADWQIIVAEQNRASVLNLVDDGTSRIHVEAFLNNASGECNTSPQLGLFNLPFVCVNSDFFYNLSFNDPDGDSLVYALTPAITSDEADMPLDMPYEPGYSPAAPIDNLTFNPETGQMDMTPTTEGKYTIVVEVREYRDGVLIGVVYLDFNVIVIPCAVPPPTPLPGSLEQISGGGYPISDNQIGICAGDDFCLELDFVSTDPLLELTLSADIAEAIPGATFTQTGVNPATIEFCGTIPSDFIGGDFVISAIDDFCSIYGQAFYAVQFVLREPMFAGPDTTICAGESVQLFAENDISYTWSDLDGNQIPVGPDFSCNPCANPVATPDTSSVYIVQGEFIDGVCAATDTVVVDVPLSLEIEVIPETCFENDGVIEIAVLNGSGSYTVVWGDDPTITLVRADLNEGTYNVTITDEIYSCSTSRTFIVENLISPDANAGGDDFACGTEYQLEAIPSFGESLWTSSDPEISILDPTSPNSIVTASSIGVYELVWTEEDGDPINGCIDRDTIQIEFFDQPTAMISAVDSVCGSEVELTVFGSNGIPNWDLSTNVTLVDPLSDPVIAVADIEGLELIIYQSVNGPCVAADTASVEFIDQPVSDAGVGDIVCGDEVNLFAAASVGIGVWILPDELIPFGTPVGPSLEVTATVYGFYDIIWRETNKGFCQDSDTIEVGFVEQPVIEPLADTLICGPSAEIPASLNSGNLLWEGDIGLSITDNSANPVEIGAAPGTYELRLTADNGFDCIAFDTLNLTFLEQPVLPPSVVDSVCGFETELISPISGFPIEWSSPDLSLSSTTDQQVIATSLAEGDFTVSLVASNQAVCYDTTIYALSFYEQPLVSAQGDFSVCGLIAQVQATTSVGDLLWESSAQGSTFSNPSSATTDFSVIDFGEATAVILEKNGPCATTDSVTVSFEPSPQIVNPILSCTGIDATYQVAFDALGDYGSGFIVTGLEGAFSGNAFLSDFVESGMAVSFSLSNNTVCTSADFTGSLTCPVTSSAGEMSSDTVRTCGEEPAVVTQSVPPVLDGNDVLKYVLHDSNTNVLGNIFAWSDIPEFTYNEDLQVNTTYYVSSVVGNPLGDQIDLTHPQVSISVGQPVIFLPQPTVLVNYDEIICPTDTAIVLFEFAGNLPQTFTYTFGGIETTLQVDESPLELMFTDSGMVEPLSTLSAYCVGDGIGVGQIQFHPEPDLIYDWDPEICTGDTSLLQINTVGVAPFQFDLNGEFGEQSYLISGDTALALTIGGSYSITNYADQLCPVLDTFALELVEYPLPLVDAGSDELACTGDTLLIGSSPISGVTYSWAFNTSVLEPSLSFTPFAALNEGFFPQENELILTATDINCTNRDTVLVTVYSFPELQIFAPGTICQGDSTDVIGYGAPNLSWSPAQLFSNPDSSQTRLYTPTSTEISLMGTNEAGCTSEVSWDIEVAPIPEVEIVASTVAGCDPLLVDFTAVDTAVGSTYQWSFNSQPVGESSPNVSQEFSTGQYTIALEVTSAAGCSRTTQLPGGLSVYTTEADFSFFPEKPSITSPKVTFTSLAQNAEFNFWRIDTLDLGSGEWYTYEFPSDVGGAYEVCLDVISNEGCVDSTCQTVTVADDFFVYIPTAFTPDGDGLNDLFAPQLSRIDIAEYRFWITNRNGRVVFETNDPNEKWNGSENNAGYFGRSDLYQWHLSAKPDFNLEERFYNGKVMVIR
ncbi:gliding motility-associated C-terminal domain-containing protein [Cryomorphaceae bacterium 1068]|nr:gliding motility-associated C-terminal domain-containing protein [Cryomorphaceae bacterium 1068]